MVWVFLLVHSGITRRGFLRLLLASLVLPFIPKALKEPCYENGFIAVDTHAHPKEPVSEQEIIDFFEAIDGRVLALCERKDIKSFFGKPILSYMRAIDICNLAATQFSMIKDIYSEELEKGIFAKLGISLKDGRRLEGHIIRSQEIGTGHNYNTPHIIALGLEGKLLPNDSSPQNTLARVNSSSWLSILAHPFLGFGSPIRLPYVLGKEEAEALFEKVIEDVGAVEVFNAYCSGFPPLCPYLSKTNMLATNFLTAHNLTIPVTAASDSHGSNDMLFSGANFIPEPKVPLTLSHIVDSIVSNRALYDGVESLYCRKPESCEYLEF